MRVDERRAESTCHEQMARGGEDRGERRERSLRGVNLAQENIPFPLRPGRLNLGEVQSIFHLLMMCF